MVLAFLLHFSIHVNSNPDYNQPFSSTEEIIRQINKVSKSSYLNTIIDKVIQNISLSLEDGYFLFKNAELGLLGLLADYKNQILNNNKVYFNKNIHIEPTNYCVYNCKFCSYSRRMGDKEGWLLSLDDIKNYVKKYINSGITEVHMVGGVHPEWGLDHYKKMIESIKELLPDVTVKAYTAVEIVFISKKSGLSIKDVLTSLHESGLDAMPGGGAEIFNPKIRAEICPDKCSTSEWLDVHKNAHEIGIKTNATILYGHIEKYKDRLEHMFMLRELQSATNGFNAFIPLKYRLKNNDLQIENEVSVTEDLKNYAVSRLFLDNIPHIKAYWPMIGRQTAQLSLSFGVDDLDGTIDDTTKIYTLAGVEEQKPAISSSEMIEIIKNTNRIPVERDTFYNILQIY